MKDNAGTAHYSVFPAGACRWLRPSGMLPEKPLHVALSTAPTRWQPRLTLGTHTRPRPSSLNSVFEILTIIEFNAFPSFPFPFPPLPSQMFSVQVCRRGSGVGMGAGGSARAYLRDPPGQGPLGNRNTNPFARLNRMAVNRTGSQRRR